jgi:hypothetical protein
VEAVLMTDCTVETRAVEIGGTDSVRRQRAKRALL